MSCVMDTQCEFSCEYKYDGERAQVHLTSDGKVFIYSRNSENNTSKFPDIVQFIPSVTKPGVTTMVLDCEAVAYDREEKKILPFQVRVHRAPSFLPELVHVSSPWYGRPSSTRPCSVTGVPHPKRPSLPPRLPKHAGSIHART